MATPAADHEYADIHEQMQNNREDKSRTRLLKAWLSDHQLTCEQAKGLLSTFFGLGDTKVQAAVLMHSQVTDPQNFVDVVLEQGLQYPEERQDVKQALGL
eukprot:m.480425 g.480425  ORF g.480425 m.480425 type:complete len:100 (+) comp21834_c0_seq1:59-358(+)